MIWVILCKDKPNYFKKRMEVIDEHRKYLSTNPIKTLISGPLINESGDIMNGSFFMVEADNIEEIKRFQFNDPIYKAGIWDEITISPFNKRVDNLSKNLN
tara:strand:+ start:1399 stop:1698 length:300 start_codon:yes stop_codon:yes gene_type:complete